MSVFDNILEILSIMFGGSVHSKIVKAGDTVSGHITTFQSREDGTTLTALEDKAGTDILADCLNGETLYAGEWFTNGRKGFSTLTVSAGSLKVDGTTLTIS